MTTEQQTRPPRNEAAEADRLSILRRLVHERWCDYETDGCACEAGQALIRLIAHERDAALREQTRITVEPLVAALREITRTVYADDAPLDSPSYSALHLKAVGIARDALAALPRTPGEEPDAAPPPSSESWVAQEVGEPSMYEAHPTEGRARE